MTKLYQTRNIHSISKVKAPPILERLIFFAAGEIFHADEKFLSTQRTKIISSMRALSASFLLMTPKRSMASMTTSCLCLAR